MNETEKKIAGYFGRKYCYLTGSGTTGIYLILKSLNKQVGHILYPAITCMTPVNAALYADMKPVFCDVNLKDYTMDINSLQNMLNQYDVWAIVPTHIYGHSCDMDKILEVARERNIFVLEDAAQAVGGSYKGKKLGSFGDASVVSFGHTKIVECGGGGAVLTDNKQIFETVKQYGSNLPKRPDNIKELFDEYRILYYDIMKLIKKDDSFWRLMLQLQLSFEKGFIYPIDQETVKRINKGLNNIKEIVEERNKRKELYDRYLNKNRIQLPSVRDESVCWRDSFLYEGNQSLLLEKVREKNIDISSWYPALYQMYSGQDQALFPNANYLEKHIINLWVTPQYSEEKIISSIQIINDILREME